MQAAENAGSAAPTLTFTTYEEALLGIASHMGPWTIQLELAAAGRLDEQRLSRAIAAACARHPLARVRLRSLERGDRLHRWLVAEHLDADPLTVLDCPDEAALEVIRGALYSAPFDLDLAPPLRVVLARRPQADLVLFSVDHVASDGIGCLRLLRAVTSAYRDEEDKPDAVSVSESRRPERVLPGGRAGDRGELAREMVRRLCEALRPPARIAADGAAEADAYGFVTRALDPEQTRALLDRKPPRASLNDLALTAVVLTIDRWNEAHGSGSERIAVSMPVNMRPREWFWDVVGNFALFVTISVRRDQRADAASTLAAVMAQTAPAHRRRRTHALFGLLKLLRPAPMALERVVASQVAGRRFVDSVVLSNLGRLPESPGFDGGDPPAVWFSPPCAMPIGVGIGLVTSGGTLRVCFRHSLRLLDAAAAGAFADLYLEQLEAVAPTSSCTNSSLSPTTSESTNG